MLTLARHPAAHPGLSIKHCLGQVKLEVGQVKLEVGQVKSWNHLPKWPGKFDLESPQTHKQIPKLKLQEGMFYGLASKLWGGGGVKVGETYE